MAQNDSPNGVDRASHLLESLNLPTRPSFAGFLEHLYRERYSGPVTFHFENGIARVVELTRAVKLPLDRVGK